MKRVILQRVVLFFVALLLLASCLGEGGNIQSGRTYGVIRYDYMKGINLLDVSETESFYSIRFNKTMDEACFLATFELDFDIPENSLEKVAENGYYTVNIYEPLELDRWQISSGLVDTTSALINEVAIVNPIMENSLTYIRGKSFIVSTVEIPTDQKMDWHLSYDSNNMVSGEGSERYYDLYLRSTVRGDAGTKSKDRISYANAFDMEYYLKTVANKEKELGKTTFKLRFNYPSAISDEGQITWGSQYSQELSVSFFVSEDN